jgi:hypothetical protein
MPEHLDKEEKLQQEHASVIEGHQPKTSQQREKKIQPF